MKAIQHLQLRSNCLYLGSGENHAEKLSGGFYDHTFIPEYAGGYSRHKYFAITYIIKGYGIFKDHLVPEFQLPGGRPGPPACRHPVLHVQALSGGRLAGIFRSSAAKPFRRSAGGRRSAQRFDFFIARHFPGSFGRGGSLYGLSVLHKQKHGSRTGLCGDSEFLRRIGRLDNTGRFLREPEGDAAAGTDQTTARRRLRHHSAAATGPVDRHGLRKLPEILPPLDRALSAGLPHSAATQPGRCAAAAHQALNQGDRRTARLLRHHRILPAIPEIPPRSPSSKRDILPPAAWHALPPGTPPLDTDAGYGFEPAARSKAPGKE